MKRLFLLSLLFFAAVLCSNAQVLDLYINEKTKKVESRIKKDLKKYPPASTCYRRENDSLFVTFSSGKETVHMKMAFDKHSGICTYEEIDFDCSECLDKHLKDVLEIKTYGFRKTEENKYISKTYYKAELEVFRYDGQPVCLRLVFRLNEMERGAYNKRYKSIR